MSGGANGVIDTNGSALTPAQGGFRFLVELAALACWAVVGWEVGGDGFGWVLAIAFPVVAASTWATFRVPGDLSAGQGGPIPVPGIVRLIIELDVLVLSAVFAIVVGRVVLGAVVLVAIVVHYLLTMQRVRWLLAQRSVT
ncbi:MAG: YrdB family protein [Ilumatobacter fluminis]|uniref:YrdB family protein n=1 Tax=Ilumatobacter fluminis TaxID=467091 RepID=UPI0032EE2BD8